MIVHIELNLTLKEYETLRNGIFRLQQLDIYPHSNVAIYEKILRVLHDEEREEDKHPIEVKNEKVNY